MLLHTIRAKKIWTEGFDRVQGSFEDLEVLYEFHEAGEVGEDELDIAYHKTLQEIEELEFKRMLNKEEDQLSAMVEINPGAGGTESQDWAEMLYRMYLRWAEQHGYKVEEVDSQPGDEAGIKSATLRVSGGNAYGWLKTESGVHRLVRISPFDSAARRHTSFASVWVYPVIDDSIEIAIEEKDVRTDTYRASGAGGLFASCTPRSISPPSGSVNATPGGTL